MENRESSARGGSASGGKMDRIKKNIIKFYLDNPVNPVKKEKKMINR
ncbi:MAG: hypothetical protein KAS99_00675 [Candidatus Omnitrophica bacterium]|nr:hypothetical protein [Candidatus Omnitrophota bacterium]